MSSISSASGRSAVSARTAIVARSNERRSRWSEDNPAKAGSSRPPSASAAEAIAASDAVPATASATSGAPMIDRARRNGPRSSSSAPTATVRKPRATAISRAASRRRVLPIPGSPSTETAVNRPPCAAVMPSSIATSSVGRPTTARPVRCSRSPRGANAAAATGGATLMIVLPGGARLLDYVGRRPIVLSLRSRAIGTPSASGNRPVASADFPPALPSDPMFHDEQREPEWKGSAARTGSSDHRNAGRRRPTAHLEVGCANSPDAKPSSPRTTLLPSAGSMRRPRIDTPSAATRKQSTRSLLSVEARPEGLEPPTCWSVASRSDPLS